MTFSTEHTRCVSLLCVYFPIIVADYLVKSENSIVANAFNP